ncbi:MAG: hypothetical protein IPN05_08545 [Sulfuritalea sp.]|nr:hypothetical protein [Sulfuritalea sp.]
MLELGRCGGSLDFNGRLDLCALGGLELGGLDFCALGRLDLGRLDLGRLGRLDLGRLGRLDLGGLGRLDLGGLGLGGQRPWHRGPSKGRRNLTSGRTQAAQ